MKDTELIPFECVKLKSCACWHCPSSVVSHSHTMLFWVPSVLSKPETRPNNKFPVMNVVRQPITPQKAGSAHCNNNISLAVSGQRRFALLLNAWQGLNTTSHQTQARPVVRQPCRSGREAIQNRRTYTRVHSSSCNTGIVHNSGPFHICNFDCWHPCRFPCPKIKQTHF